MQPNCTIGVDFHTGRITGEIDGKEALAQAATLALQTPRWEFPIFSGDYGSELYGLMGKERALIVGEMERMVSEALSRDERFLGVEDVALAFTEDAVHSSSRIKTAYGVIKEEMHFGI